MQVDSVLNLLLAACYQLRVADDASLSVAISYQCLISSCGQNFWLIYSSNHICQAFMTFHVHEACSCLYGCCGWCNHCM